MTSIAEAARRRARAQWPLLAALLGVVTVGATLLGTCALLITRTAERALEVAAARAAPDDVDVTAYTGTVEGPDARSVAADTRAVLTSALAPFPTTTAARASSVLRALPPTLAAGTTVPPQAYLSGVDDLPARAQLTAGRWPQARGAAPLEAVLLEQHRAAARPRPPAAGSASAPSCAHAARPADRRDRRRHRPPAARRRLGPRPARRHRLRTRLPRRPLRPAGQRLRPVHRRPRRPAHHRRHHRPAGDHRPPRPVRTPPAATSTPPPRAVLGADRRLAGDARRPGPARTRLLRPAADPAGRRRPAAASPPPPCSPSPSSAAS